MPALSVLLVVHREQAFLEECIGSVLADRGADVELLVIDDASPDHGPAILDRLARADERMRVVHLPERAGRAAARDLALEQASGEHV
ncbi:MAG: hypothetical protein QOI80_852, partial [Solirubrobacteraceae bacterium]|nr:hypothetical protein [Solirubrobacteraceae bacterium]